MFREGNSEFVLPNCRWLFCRPLPPPPRMIWTKWHKNLRNFPQIRRQSGANLVESSSRWHSQATPSSRWYFSSLVEFEILPRKEKTTEIASVEMRRISTFFFCCYIFSCQHCREFARSEHNFPRRLFKLLPKNFNFPFSTFSCLSNLR